MKALVVVLVSAVLSLTACGGSDESSNALLTFANAKGCKAKDPNKVSSHTIVKVTGNACLIADNDAIVIARGKATVAAHDKVTVDAGGEATVIVYNNQVRCKIRGPNVTTIDAVRDVYIMHSSCWTP